MTSDKAAAVRRALVVAFDICSSSNIVEDLTLNDNLPALRGLLVRLQSWLQKHGSSLDLSLYKFTGDGWLLLFPEEVDGPALRDFLVQLCRFYQQEFAASLADLLETEPALTGLTFGAEKGSLVQLSMRGTEEYIGRALNIACRLQGAVADHDGSAAYQALVSRQVFNTYFRQVDGLVAKRARRTLRNIRDGKEFQCMKVWLLGDA
jgi:class 3 adenylate cyclase